MTMMQLYHAAFRTNNNNNDDDDDKHGKEIKGGSGGSGVEIFF